MSIVSKPRASAIDRSWLVALPVFLLLSLASVALSQNSSGSVSFTSSTPQVALATAPLYASGTRAKPTLTLALSVEYPTVGAQYRGTNDYSTATAYPGYFNPDLCYRYNPVGQQFNPYSAASGHACAGAGFSGNFMNWASSSAIDILRYALTGGDRIVDLSNTTVLQRAVLPSNFYNSSQNFPAKTLPAALVNGALPSSLLTKAGATYNGDVYIANCLNQIYFGSSSTGSCGSPGDNASLGQLPTPVSSVSNKAPSGVTNCAAENGTCTLPAGAGARLVYYGATSGSTSRYVSRIVFGSIACSNAVFGDPYSGVGKACYYANSDSTDPSYTSDGGQTGTGFFLTRVAVCGSMTGATADVRSRPFCTRYPSGYYKPTGDLQTYSDRIRVAAFGYLIDNTINRYGGVLRAPMKYVGPNAYDSDFNLVSGGNTQAEWSQQDGTFVPDPMGEGNRNAIAPRTTAISGVINYLNQFGRTGNSGGIYKTYDPINELYYEALRYLQGLPPTPQATAGMTDAMKDGFPVYNTLTTLSTSNNTAVNRSANLPTSPNFLDPLPAIGGRDVTTAGSYTCVSNSILAIGDIHVHYDRSLPGNTQGDGNSDFSRTASPAGNMPDFSFWTQVIGAFETNTTMSYIDGDGVTRSTTNGSAGYNPAPVSDLYGMYSTPQTFYRFAANPSDYFMAGAAYWAHTHDIRGLPVTGDNSNNALAQASSTDLQRPGMRVTTYMIDVNETNSSTALSDRQRNEYFLAAKYGGFSANASQGGNPFLATNANNSAGTAANLWQRSGSTDPQTYFLASDADAMLNSIDQIFATIAADATSIAPSPLPSAQVTVANGGTYGFRASFSSTYWQGDLYPYAITTADNSTATAGNASLWHAAAKLDSQVWSATSRNIYVGSDTSGDGTGGYAFSWSNLSSTQKASLANNATTGAMLVAYLSGDRSNEAPASAGLRKRGSALGDIVNSGIAYEGAPSTTTYGDSDYATFYSSNASRQPTVYVGANDGMLHAFNARTDGNADGGKERFAYIPSFLVGKLQALTNSNYVHQSYVDGTPVVREAKVGSSWKTVLVSGVGGGAQGVFALDVTDPTSFTASNVLWEFTDSNDADLGNVVGTPGIYRFQTGTSDGTPVYKWFAVVASGVNNYASDGHVSTTGNPAIFLLDLSKPAGTAWALGTNYFKISLPQSSASSPMGVINFSVMSQNGVASRIYAGDLQGNLWSLNFAGVSSGNWDFNHVNARSSGQPMFIAQTGDSTPKPQPISVAPELAGYGNNVVLIFGTGQYLASTDNTGPYTTQTAYAVLDPVGIASTAVPSTLYRSDLQSLSLSTSNGTVTGGGFTWGVPSSSSVKAGWYFDLTNSANSGERFAFNFLVNNGLIFANSIIPSAGGCSTGSGVSYTLSLAGGTGSYSISTVGLLGAPALILVGNASNSLSPTGTATQTQGTVRLNTGSNSQSVTGSPPLVRDVGVRSWREIFSYQDLKN